MSRTTYNAQGSHNFSWRLDTNTVDRSHKVGGQTDNTDHRNQAQSSYTEEGLTERKSTVTWNRHFDWTFDRGNRVER
jgi:hypothetical protein